MWAEAPTREQIILGMPGSRKTKTRATDSVLGESVYFVGAISSTVEQLTLNQLVGGSNPSWLTKHNDLRFDDGQPIQTGRLCCLDREAPKPQ
jgi:hypothetical protein